MARTTLERLSEWFTSNCVFIAGALFGAGWWVWGDAITVSIAVQGQAFAPILLVPGLVATLAILVMNCVPRSEVSSDNILGDDASLCRNRLTLFIAYVFSFAAIAGAVAILLSEKASQSAGEAGEPTVDLWTGAAGIIQACLIVSSGVVVWYWRDADEDSGYGYL